MSRALRVTALAAVLSVSAAPAAPSSQQSEAVQQNLAAAEAWDAAFNSENVDAVMELYGDGAVSVPPGAAPLVGKPAIRADYEFVFANFNLHHRTTVVQLEVQGSMAVERGEYVMTDETGAIVETGKHMIVRRRINGAWVSVMETWNTY